MAKRRRMVFDCESVGLHGETFSVGWVVLLGDKVVGEVWARCPPENAKGTDDGRAWVRKNCPWAAKGMSNAQRSEHDLPEPIIKRTPAELADLFWRAWLVEKAQGARLWADVPWPVESRFLVMAVENERPRTPGRSGGDVDYDYLKGQTRPANSLWQTEREWEGPYPLFDVRTYVESLIGADVSSERAEAVLGPAEVEPVMVHHPLCDARVSAQKILQVERVLREVLPS